MRKDYLVICKVFSWSNVNGYTGDVVSLPPHVGDPLTKGAKPKLKESPSKTEPKAA